MSFILDALRKSEHERQRQTGPALAEIPVAAVKPKTNFWATAAVILLLVNLVAVGVLLLRRAHSDAPHATSPAAATAPPESPAGGPVQGTPRPAVTQQSAPQASVTRTLPQPQLQEPAPAGPYPAARNPLEDEVSPPPGMDGGMAAGAASVPSGPPAVSPVPGSGHRGSVVYESWPAAAADEAIAAEKASPSSSQAQSPPVPQPSGLPTADEITARGGLPSLHLDLHVYSTRPQERFVFINSRKYREGDTLAEGPVVEQITQSGAVLNYRGSRFLLTSN